MSSQALQLQLEENLRLLESETERYKRNMLLLLEYQKTVLSVSTVWVRSVSFLGSALTLAF